MNLVISRVSIDARMLEVRSLISFIKTQESTATPPVDTDAVKIVRGLFYVHLYGAFEKTVNECVETYLRSIAALELEVLHVAPQLMPLALDAKFRSLHSVPGTSNWRKRIALIDSMVSAEVCAINDLVFAEQLQNVWPETIENIVEYLGIGGITFDEADVLACKEIVDKRNQVAHGRTSPLKIGASVKAIDLESRFESILSLLEEFIVFLETKFVTLIYVKPEYHAHYNA
jgi:hypothetical protein